MLKLKSRSLIVNEYQDDLLKQHIEKLVEKSQQIVNEKLQRQHEKQVRVSAVQKEFVSWADKKETQIKVKIQKSSKNKQEHISKIVKKCKEHERFLGQKLKNYQNKKKASLREAWIISQKYKNSFDVQELQNKINKSKSIENKNQLIQSQLYDNKQIPNDKKKQYLSAYYPNPSKLYANSSKNYWGQLNQSVRQLKMSQPIHFLTEVNQQMQDKQEKKKEQKLKEALTRFQHNITQSQQLKIQQLGQRLQKIEKGRIRKFELIKKKQEKHNNILGDYNHLKRDKKVNRQQRIQSETMMREKRVRDWSEINKSKRQEFFQMHLQNGSNYLSNQKIKYIKTTAAKRITLQAIQKKLYFQRLSH